MSTKVELYQGRNGVRIQETRDGLELAFFMHGEQNPRWTRLQINPTIISLLEEAIQDYRHNLVIAPGHNGQKKEVSDPIGNLPLDTDVTPINQIRE